MEARPAQRGQQRDRQDAVPAEPEEVLVDPGVLQPQHLRDGRAHGPLVVGDGPGRGGRSEFGLGQGAPVELAVGGQRELRQHDDVGGHHVLHQVPGGPLPDVLGPQVLAAGRRDHVPDQVGAARAVLLRDDAGVPHPGVFGEPGLDVLQFEPHAADLDLVVGTAEEVQRAVRGEPGEVAGPVEP